MKYEIGSEFGLEEVMKRSGEVLFAEELDLRWLMSGRCALYYILKDIAHRDKRGLAYLPAYLCHTVIGPFKKAGYQIMFYDVGMDLKPLFDEKLLDRLSVVVISDYFGFTNLTPDFIKLCKQQGIIVIEDMSHAMFSKPISNYADYAFGSLRKWIGIPAGGWASSKYTRFTLPMKESNNLYLQKRTEALKLRKKYLENLDPELKNSIMELFAEAEHYLEEKFDSFGGDILSAQIADSYPWTWLKEKRRSNYQVIRGCLDNHLIMPLFSDLPPEICPMFFPIYTNNRDGLKAWLIENRIYPPVHWPIPTVVELRDFVIAKRIYSSILSLPCDQRYEEEDMIRMCEVINAYRF